MYHQRHIIIVILVVCIGFCTSAKDYAFADEPTCRDDCSGLIGLEQSECLKHYMEFYSYKFVKSIVNFGKISVFAGIWSVRNDNADLELFDKVFQRLLTKYNNPNILGNVDFQELNRTVQFVYDALRGYTRQDKKGVSVKYEYYPSLKCSVPCIYELTSWQTLFYLSLAIFFLALVTVVLYSLSLRSQYSSLKGRLGNAKSSPQQINSDT